MTSLRIVDTSDLAGLAGSSSSLMNPPEYRRSHSADEATPRAAVHQPRARRRSSGDGDSSAGGPESASGAYEVIEYDAADDGGGDLGSDFLNELDFRIEDNTPAADALRANAGVHVSMAGKAARAVNMQVVRKAVKRATMTSKSGIVRGKPPRIPPTQQPQGAPAQPPSELEGARVLTPPRRRTSTSASLSSAPEDDALSKKSVQPLPMPQIEDEAHIEDDVVAGTREASKQVLGDVDPHGYLRLLRWKRKRNKAKKPKSYVKGKVINGEHELYTLSIAVMIGVRTSISRTHTEISNRKQGWITDKDFHAMEKYEFRPKGGRNGITPPHQLAHTFKFKDYAPVIFAYLRRLAGVNEFDFLLSVCGNANFIEFISNAKSGQFFFYSSDGRFMIKTMTNAESKFLRRILPQYFRHCVENPNTMMTRFFGMYRVKLYHLRRNVKFVIMNSVYYTDKFLQTFYDLKGSSVGREAKPGDAVKKDNDLRRALQDEALVLHPSVRQRVREQVVRDCAFLESIGAMDYSMLVGVHHIPHRDTDSLATSGFQGSRTSARLSRKGLLEEHERSQMDVNCANFRGTGARGGEDESSLELSGEHENGSVGGKVLHSVNTVESPSKVHRRNLSESIGNFFLENGLDDDDNSYLNGSTRRPVSGPVSNHESENKKLATIEKLYWPFHRLYDIHGHRRLVPHVCHRCGKGPCVCSGADDAQALGGYQIPEFVPPLSERKDAGYEMDTSGLRMPLIYLGPEGEVPYDGRIFYMGIIDVLQEYTTRKALESQYRYVQTHGRPEASCVPPTEYAERFIRFLDEVTRRPGAAAEEAATPAGAADVDLGTALSTVGEDPQEVEPLHHNEKAATPAGSPSNHSSVPGGAATDESGGQTLPTSAGNGARGDGQ